MKTQISRASHDSEKRYSGVYQQQGRMLTDADWNELTDIVKGRLDDALVDVVGNGTPKHRKLRIVKNGSDWEIVPGYVRADGMIAPCYVCVDGIIAHLPGQPEHPINYLAQPDLTSPRPIPDDCILYADVWERSVTALEDGDLMDSALYGADTCTRTKTMLQIKWCDSGTRPELLPNSGDAKLSIRIREGVAAPDPCDPCAAEISLDARTGNELFRLEIHDVRYLDDDPAKAVVGVCLKWSGENGAEQYALKDHDGKDLAPPEAFKEANRVFEFYNTETEQNLGLHPAGTPLPVHGEISQGYSLPATGKPQDYVRRWDGYCVLKNTGGNWSIEAGFDQSMANFVTSPEVSLDAASGALTVGLESILFELSVKDRMLLPGDYWMLPLREREIRAELEKQAADSAYSIPALLAGKNPHGLPPHGVTHHYLELANILGGNLLENPEADRKYAFPPLTEMTRLFMAGGDGQEVVPGQPLPQPLRVGVANGEWPVQGAMVRFQIEGASSGSLSPVNGGKTNADGIAQCVWTPDSTIGTACRVKASLVDAEHARDAGQDLNPPVYFYAHLITADQVAYVPGCEKLKDTVNVQQAIDLLCKSKSAGCTVSVGAGGEFSRLDDAVTQLIKAGRMDICICLLPGDHDLGKGLKLSGKFVHHLKIVGCAGSRIILGDAGEIHFSGLRSVVLRDLSIYSGNKPLNQLVFNQCHDVEIAACHMYGLVNRKTVVVSIADAGNIYLAHNVIEAQQLTSLNKAAEIFGFSATFAKLYQTHERAGFDAMALEQAAVLAKMKPAEKKSFSENIAKNTRRSPERQTYKQFIQLIIAPKPSIASLQGMLGTIRDMAVRHDAGIALALMDAEAETMLDHNTVAGSVSLYGIPPAKSLGRQQLNKLDQNMKKGASFEVSTGVLTLRNNRLNRLLLGSAMVKAVLEALKQVSSATGSPTRGLRARTSGRVRLPAGGVVAAPVGGVVTAPVGGTRTAPAGGVVVAQPPARSAPVILGLAGMYRIADLSNNHFDDLGNELLSGRATVSSNDFAGASAGFVIAKSATYTGNNGPTNNSLLQDITQISSESGNIIAVN